MEMRKKPQDCDYGYSWDKIGIRVFSHPWCHQEPNFQIMHLEGIVNYQPTSKLQGTYILVPAAVEFKRMSKSIAFQNLY